MCARCPGTQGGGQGAQESSRRHLLHTSSSREALCLPREEKAGEGGARDLLMGHFWANCSPGWPLHLLLDPPSEGAVFLYFSSTKLK